MAHLDEYTGTWSLAQASHLLRRAGFGGTPAERQALAASTMAAAVNSLVDVLPDDPFLDQPGVAGTGTYGSPLADLPDVPVIPGSPTFIETDLISLKQAVLARPLQAHWLYRMVYSSQPFQEQFTLFLHDHMPSDFEKVATNVPQSTVNGNDGDPLNLLPFGAVQECNIGPGGLAYDPLRREMITVEALKNQNYLHRREGLNRFDDLLAGIVRDPAMLSYLDNFLNVAGRPQENLAREMMELFSMGVGNYSENDIQQVAKCITGETLPNFTCALSWDPSYGFSNATHEPGSKTVFGQAVPYSALGQETLDVVQLILAKTSVVPRADLLAPPYNTLPAAAIYLSWKLIRWFADENVSLDPPDAVVLELAHYMRGTDGGVYPQRRYPYDMKAVMGKLLRSEYFFDSSRFNLMYKNPADFLVGAMRALGIFDIFAGNDGPSGRMTSMGMSLFQPPDVSGWQNGQSWLASAAVVARYNFAYRVAHLLLPNAAMVAIIDTMPFTDSDHPGMIAYLSDLLFHDNPTPEEDLLLNQFLDGVPLSDLPASATLRKRRKVQSLVHLMLTMPRYQLK